MARLHCRCLGGDPSPPAKRPRRHSAKGRAEKDHHVKERRERPSPTIVGPLPTLSPVDQLGGPPFLAHLEDENEC